MRHYQTKAMETRMNANEFVGVYLRCSADSQDTDSQKAAVKRYLDGNAISVIEKHWFEDAGKSGKNLDRPALKRLQQAVFNGEIRKIVFPSVDRFARTMITGLMELDSWSKAGVTLVFVRESIEVNPKDWAGQIVMKIIVSLCLAMAEAERERILARQQAGIDQAVARANTLRKLRQNNPHLDIKVIARMAGYKRVSHAQYVLDHPYSKTHWGGRPKGARKVKGLTADKLQEYLDRGFTVAEIAKIHKVVRSTVYDWMDKLGLKRDEEDA
jgi:DNA invertase Pin-like site-specific DNA recombinase